MSTRMWSWLALSLPVCALAQSLPATAFLQRLPLVSAQHICTDKDAPRTAFQLRLSEVTEALGAEIVRRERVLKDVRRHNQKTTQQALAGTPGVGGVDAEAMKKMSRAERQQLSQQLMLQQYGVSPEEIAKLKAMKKSGNTEGIAGWGKAFSAEQQAAAAANPAAAAQSHGKALQTAQLAERQAVAAQRIGAALTKADVQLRELETDPAGLAELARLGALRQRAAALQPCEARKAALMALYNDETRYCGQMSVRHGAILESLRTAVVALQGEHEDLDRIEAEIQRLQFGIEPVPEQLGLSALKTVRDYAQRLGDAYQYNLHGARPDFATYCTRQ